MNRRQQSLFQKWSGFTSSSKKWNESESVVNESEAVYHHDCDKAYEPSAISKLADSELKLDGHVLACHFKKVPALRPVTATSAECSYSSNERETAGADAGLSEGGG